MSDDKSGEGTGMANISGPASAVTPIAVSPAEIDRLVSGAHHNPHGILGAHARDGVVTIRTLRPNAREVTALRLHEKKEKREDDDAVPRDLSELRLALARRLDQLVADAKTAHPDATE